jgi:hypothetical protein
LNWDCPSIRGLGTELVKRSEILARDLGCEVAVAIGQFSVLSLISERKIKHTSIVSLTAT